MDRPKISLVKYLIEFNDFAEPQPSYLRLLDRSYTLPYARMSAGRLFTIWTPKDFNTNITAFNITAFNI